MKHGRTSLENTAGSYFGGLNNRLRATRTDDLPASAPGFERIADAADSAMIQVLAEDLALAKAGL